MCLKLRPTASEVYSVVHRRLFLWPMSVVLGVVFVFIVVVVTIKVRCVFWWGGDSCNALYKSHYHNFQL